MTRIHGELIYWLPHRKTTGNSKILVNFMEIFQVTEFQEKLLSTSTRGKLPVTWTKGDCYLVDLVVQRDLQ